MTETIELTIDGISVGVPSGTTILQAAQQAGIKIPVLCYFAHTTANGLCRLCVVEIEDVPGMHPACIVTAKQDAVVHTRSPAIDRIRKTIMEMLDEISPQLFVGLAKISYVGDDYLNFATI